MELQEYYVSSLTQIPVHELRTLRQAEVRTVLYQAPVHAQVVGIATNNNRPVYIEKVCKLGKWNFSKPMPYQQSTHVWQVNGYEVTVEQLISIIYGYNRNYKLEESINKQIKYGKKPI